MPSSPTLHGGHVLLDHLTSRQWFVGLYVDRSGREAATPGYARGLVDPQTWTDTRHADRRVVASSEVTLPMVTADHGERAVGYFLAAAPRDAGSFYVPVDPFDLAEGVIPVITPTLAVKIGA